MSYDPETFEAKKAALRAGALAYIASVRTPGASAESLLPDVVAWIRAQSDADRTLDVSAVEIVYAGTLSENMVMQYGSVPDQDGFGFRVSVLYSDGLVLGTAVYVRVSRQELEGA